MSLELTQYWLKNIIIDLELCPFAKIPFEKGLIKINICEDETEDDFVTTFISELEILNEQEEEKLSTTLITFVNGHSSFYDFYDFVGELEDLVSEAGLSEFVQLVCFHPDFHFDGLEMNERANLVNRAPFPIIQLIRSSEIARALKNPEEGERISFNNSKKLEALSESDLKQLFHYLAF